MARGVDKRDIAAALTPAAVLEHFQIDYQRSGTELRFAICPECGPRSREDTVSVNRTTGRWKDHAHGCGGDLLAMVAGFAGIDVRRNFQAVLEAAAEIAGVAA